MKSEFTINMHIYILCPKYLQLSPKPMSMCDVKHKTNFGQP